ncbi:MULTISPECIES: inositol monophosphatase family protein [unclassified Actinoplanes]|uniref:inositol monophosphatase family protein n=1 Tax=unclassified Actinoplanes TaxID=2626549 RepID=UPI001E3D1F9E|nr:MULTISPECIES: inositol monophosphatase family protein [unclassified Actinoplanes]
MVHEASRDLLARGEIRLGVLQRHVSGDVDRLGRDDAERPAVGQQPAEVGVMMTDYTDLLPVAHQAVDLARKIMRTMQPGALTAKGDRDMASEVDYAIEDQVRTFLAKRIPEIGFLGEENGLSGTTERLVWALDPVDGTVNFVHGSPLCAVSLGLITENRSVLGVIDLPFLGSRYSAAEGNGAHADGQPILVSTTQRISDAVVALGDYAVGQDAAEKNRARFAVTQRLAASVQRVRMHGSAAIDLAWLAIGRVDAVVMLANKPWDTAAGVVIAREAGALIADRDGSPHSFASSATIAANPGLLSGILDLAGGDHR